MNVIIGAGAVGTVLAAYLIHAREPVAFLVRDSDVERFQGHANLMVTPVHSGAPLRVARPSLMTKLPDSGVKRIFFCVKHPDLPELFASLPETLADDVELFPCLNGATVGRVFSERFPNNAVTPVGILFNARLREPLHAQITMKPALQLQGVDKETLSWLQKCGFQAERADKAMVWGKLLTSLGHPICALTHSTSKDLLTQADLKSAYGQVLDEATLVLDHAGIGYQLNGFASYGLYRQLLRHGGPLLWWRARSVQSLSDTAYPSMVADLDLGRKTEIEQINGEIVRLGVQFKTPTPLNQRLVSMIHAAEQDPVTLSPAELLQELEAAISPPSSS